MQKWGDFDTAHTLSDQDIVSTLARIHGAETDLAASRLALLAEADRRGLAMRLGQSSIKRWYGHATRIPEGNASRQIALGYWLGEHRAVADALADGTIHYLHARAIADGHATVVAADPTLDDDAQHDVIAVLLDVASSGVAKAVTDRAQELAHRAAADARARHHAEQRERARKAAAADTDRDTAADEDTAAGGDTAADGDTAAGGDTAADSDTAAKGDSATDRDGGSGAGDDADDTQGGPAGSGGGKPGTTDDADDGPAPLPMSENTALNSLTIFLLANGRGAIEGDFDALTIEALKTALSSVSAPSPGKDGTRDPRTPSRRNADGFRKILDRYLRGRGTSGGSGGADVKLLVRLSDLMNKPTPTPSGDNDGDSGGNTGGGVAPTPEDADWPFRLQWTGAISRYLAEYLSCDANLTPVIVDDHGVPLMLGRTIRLASAGQREALIVRDRCCVMCGRPAQWCVVHHVEYWNHGGRTDLNNLALLCRECHRQVHNSEWQLFMGADGHPYAIPPATVDPEQRPIPSYYRRRKRTA